MSVVDWIINYLDKWEIWELAEKNTF